MESGRLCAQASQTGSCGRCLTRMASQNKQSRTWEARREAWSAGAWERRRARLAAVRAALSGVPASGPASSRAACSWANLRDNSQILTGHFTKTR